MRLGLGDFLRSKDRVPDLEVQVDSERAQPDQGFVSIPIDKIRPNPFQPRRAFDEESIGELASSIAEHGLLQPLVVRPAANGYQLLMGERRFRACERLGFTEVQAVVRTADDRDAAVLALIENMQREDLTLFDEVEGLRRLGQEFDLSQLEIAQSLGRSQSTIANKLRLLKLAPEAREIISQEMLSERHARALLAFEQEEDQIRGARHIADRRMNVRQAEDWIAQQIAGAAKPKRQQRIRGVYKDARLFVNSVRSLVTQLEQAGVGVEIDEESTSEYVEVRVRIRTGKGVE